MEASRIYCARVGRALLRTASPLLLCLLGILPSGMNSGHSAVRSEGHLQAVLPSWAAPIPDHNLALGGLTLLEPLAKIEVYHASEEFGTYNHAAMLDYAPADEGQFILAWKNGLDSEDKRGQRILFSRSSDGIVWSKTDGHNVLFPDMSTARQSAAMFVGPFIHINGRRYAGASPGIPTSAAEGAQFCLWPDPLSPRNCGPPPFAKMKKGKPKYHEATDTLLMREIMNTTADGGLGPLFWAAQEVPRQWTEASKKLGIKVISEMDSQTQQDVHQLSATENFLPCPSPASGLLKCEACAGGCQRYIDIPRPTQPHIGNERTHYDTPPSSPFAEPGAVVDDVLLYRSGVFPVLFASVRTAPGQQEWSPPARTNIPNDESNLNTGKLPDGRIFLLNNAVVIPKNETSTISVQAELGRTETLRFRDPLTIASSADGRHFNNSFAVMTCTNLSSTSTCSQRHSGTGKNWGPSYPQGLVVTAPAPAAHRGLWVVATNNKEDVWLVKLDFASF
eukprot:SAG31_NODE_4940_length_2847_cov_5.790393_1_plen_506_part_00